MSNPIKVFGLDVVPVEPAELVLPDDILLDIEITECGRFTVRISVEMPTIELRKRGAAEKIKLKFSCRFEYILKTEGFHVKISQFFLVYA